jgi:hypothetical protein
MKYWERLNMLRDSSSTLARSLSSAQVAVSASAATKKIIQYFALTCSLALFCMQPADLKTIQR